MHLFHDHGCLVVSWEASPIYWDRTSTRECTPVILPTPSALGWLKCSICEDKSKLADWYADNRSEYLASGRDWRTPPLWGIGLTQAVNGHTQFLHDGRARNLLEAILWHGGEAEAAKQQVLAFNAEERAALLAFLNSL